MKALADAGGPAFSTGKQPWYPAWDAFPDPHGVTYVVRTYFICCCVECPAFCVYLISPCGKPDGQVRRRCTPNLLRHSTGSRRYFRQVAERLARRRSGVRV
jgi:hypothetical protein